MHADRNRETLNNWLNLLSSPEKALSLDAEGNCFLVADNEVRIGVSCPEGSQQLVLLSPLIPLPIPLSARLYEELLALNLSIDFTAGTSICFDKRTRALGLVLARDIDSLDELTFRNLLTNFKCKAAEMKTFLDALLYGDPLAGAETQFSNSRSSQQAAFGHMQEGR